MKLSEGSPDRGESPENRRGIDLRSVFNLGKKLLVAAGLVSAEVKPTEHEPPCVFLNERDPGTDPCYYFYLDTPFSRPTYFCVYASTRDDANRVALKYFEGLSLAGKVFTRQLYPIDETPAQHMMASRADGSWR